MNAMEKAFEAMRPKRFVCPCGRAFTTVQGLGLHWRWNRRKKRDCESTKDKR